LGVVLAIAAGVLSNATAQSPACNLDRLQELFAERARPEAAIKETLQVCHQTGNRDYRIPLFEGVMARDHGNLREAASLLKQSHELAPQEAVPALELALTEEWMARPHEARELYQQVLQSDPTSRAANLGLARVARSQYRFAEASSIYQKLLQNDPGDRDALEGVAWIALAEKRFGAARSGFSNALATKEDDPEARAGLKQIENAWRYQLDLNGGSTHTTAGTAGTGSGDLQINLNALHTIDFGNTYNSSELPIVQFTEPTQLPTEDVHVGYFYRVPAGFNASLVYDFRDHAGYPNEHWMTAGAGGSMGRGFQWIAEARGAFGATEWDNLLLVGGVVVPAGERWQVGLAGYFDRANFGRSAQAPNGYPNSSAFTVDINRQGPGRLFLNVGGGYSPALSNADVHARAVLPLHRGFALLGSVDHVSINNETQVNFGMRFYWR